MSDTDWEATWHGLQDVLGPKWTFHILRLLSMEPRGFTAIRDELDGLTAPMLSKRLKELGCHGFVERHVEATTPPTTTYTLTTEGEQIAMQLRELESLVELHGRPTDPDHDRNHGVNSGNAPTRSESCRDEALSENCRDEALSERCVTVVDQCNC